jgi:hypothetical protein
LVTDAEGGSEQLNNNVSMIRTAAIGYSLCAVLIDFPNWMSSSQWYDLEASLNLSSPVLAGKVCNLMETGGTQIRNGEKMSRLHLLLYAPSPSWKPCRRRLPFAALVRRTACPEPTERTQPGDSKAWCV